MAKKAGEWIHLGDDVPYNVVLQPGESCVIFKNNGEMISILTDHADHEKLSVNHPSIRAAITMILHTEGDPAGDLSRRIIINQLCEEAKPKN